MRLCRWKRGGDGYGDGFGIAVAAHKTRKSERALRHGCLSHGAPCVATCLPKFGYRILKAPCSCCCSTIARALPSSNPCAHSISSRFNLPVSRPLGDGLLRSLIAHFSFSSRNMKCELPSPHQSEDDPDPLLHRPSRHSTSTDFGRCNLCVLVDVFCAPISVILPR